MTTCRYCHKQIIMTAYGEWRNDVPYLLRLNGAVYFCNDECKRAYVERDRIANHLQALHEERNAILRSRFIVMMRLPHGWQQCGATFLTIESARAALNEYKRGPNANDTFRIFQEVE